MSTSHAAQFPSKLDNFHIVYHDNAVLQSTKVGVQAEKSRLEESHDFIEAGSVVMDEQLGVPMHFKVKKDKVTVDDRRIGKKNKKREPRTPLEKIASVAPVFGVTDTKALKEGGEVHQHKMDTKKTGLATHTISYKQKVNGLPIQGQSLTLFVDKKGRTNTVSGRIVTAKANGSPMRDNMDTLEQNAIIAALKELKFDISSTDIASMFNVQEKEGLRIFTLKDHKQTVNGAYLGKVSTRLVYFEYNKQLMLAYKISAAGQYQSGEPYAYTWVMDAEHTTLYSREWRITTSGNAKDDEGAPTKVSKIPLHNLDNRQRSAKAKAKTSAATEHNFRVPCHEVNAGECVDTVPMDHDLNPYPKTHVFPSPRDTPSGIMKYDVELLTPNKLDTRTVVSKYEDTEAEEEGVFVELETTSASTFDYPYDYAKTCRDIANIKADATTAFYVLNQLSDAFEQIGFDDAAGAPLEDDPIIVHVAPYTFINEAYAVTSDDGESPIVVCGSYETAHPYLNMPCRSSCEPTILATLYYTVLLGRMDLTINNFMGKETVDAIVNTIGLVYAAQQEWVTTEQLKTTDCVVLGAGRTDGPTDGLVYPVCDDGVKAPNGDRLNPLEYQNVLIGYEWPELKAYSFDIEANSGNVYDGEQVLMVALWHTFIKLADLIGNKQAAVTAVFSLAYTFSKEVLVDFPNPTYVEGRALFIDLAANNGLEDLVAGAFADRGFGAGINENSRFSVPFSGGSSDDADPGTTAELEAMNMGEDFQVVEDFDHDGWADVNEAVSLIVTFTMAPITPSTGKPTGVTASAADLGSVEFISQSNNIGSPEFAEYGWIQIVLLFRVKVCNSDNYFRIELKFEMDNGNKDPVYKLLVYDCMYDNEPVALNIGEPGNSVRSFIVGQENWLVPPVADTEDPRGWTIDDESYSLSVDRMLGYSRDLVLPWVTAPINPPAGSELGIEFDINIDAGSDRPEDDEDLCVVVFVEFENIGTVPIMDLLKENALDFKVYTGAGVIGWCGKFEKHVKLDLLQSASSPANWIYGQKLRFIIRAIRSTNPVEYVDHLNVDNINLFGWQESHAFSRGVRQYVVKTLQETERLDFEVNFYNARKPLESE